MNLRMMSFCQFFMSFKDTCSNDPRSGLLQRSGGRLFQSLAVLGKMSIYVPVCLHSKHKCI